MAAKCSNVSRLEVLARPKPIPDGFIDDKQSVYWDNQFTKDWTKSDLSTKFVLSDRLTQLTNPKLIHKDWKGDRNSPIWVISHGALNGKASNRLESLAEPKVHHKDFQIPKSVYTVISSSAKKALPSDRVQMLAKPKLSTELGIKPDSCWDYSEWHSDVSEAALKCEPSARVVQLAEPKKLYASYKECRSVIWDVSCGAKNALPTIRVQQLALPKKSQYKEDYDSDWDKVNPTALVAKPSPRIEELAQPLPRKSKRKSPKLTLKS
ncbi:sperm microtubule associated protein 2 isoform X2 [Hydra vulgaris]|uniref:Sperm microtubule associated protein 2 isoform X2 n=1 Tax=Hydra vulgaris TaxID=6087 RepID=A0ABM4BSN4_HYDVU